MIGPVWLSLATFTLLLVLAYGIRERQPWSRGSCILAFVMSLSVVIWDTLLGLWLAAFAWTIIATAMRITYRNLARANFFKESPRD